MLYHLTQRGSNIKRETTAAIRVFWIASFISMCALLIVLHFDGSSLSRLKPGKIMYQGMRIVDVILG